MLDQESTIVIHFDQPAGRQKIKGIIIRMHPVPISEAEFRASIRPLCRKWAKEIWDEEHGVIAESNSHSHNSTPEKSAFFDPEKGRLMDENRPVNKTIPASGLTGV